MAKKFRNTKARRREIRNFDKLWKTTLNKVGYRRRRYNVDYKPFLPITTKRDIYNLNTREIQKLNKQLQQINKKDSDFFQTRTFARGTFPAVYVNEIEDLDRQLAEVQQITDERDRSRPLIIGRDEVSNDTVLSQRLMGKDNPALTVPIKPYDFDRAKDIRSLESAIQVRRNRLSPEWQLERQEIMKENYINSIIDLYNDDADIIVKVLAQVPADDFYDIYQQYVSIDFVYVPSGDNQSPSEEQYGALDTLGEILDDYFAGKVDTSGKVFS